MKEKFLSFRVFFLFFRAQILKKASDYIVFIRKKNGTHQVIPQISNRGRFFIQKLSMTTINLWVIQVKQDQF